MNIVLVRHRQTKLNKGAHGASAERVRGWLDVALDAEGRKEARSLAKQFASRDVRAVYCSPLERARETAIGIADVSGADLHTSVCLLPWQLGNMQGQRVEDVLPAMKMHVQKEDLSPAGGEPFSAFRTRFLGFLARKLEEAKADKSESIIVLVTHTRNVQCARAWGAAGFPGDLRIDTATMDDYDSEVSPGGELWVKP